ncbi:hypothetical protein NEMIN01_1455 [Nematocida minor]|uniref:uncharacterized protein n=1 Tax=Nematocida minor TaxID=1912983 RepID=UPI00221FC733|nr:uncharacterized protein NEMIN01_1455 [Nematocida minor]KAI5191296.1 hypothetical protein NEMIN01_1455 [Nematocida minor]
MGRQKKVLDKEWEVRTLPQYDYNSKSDILDSQEDDMSSGVNNYGLLYEDREEAADVHGAKDKQEKRSSNRRVVNRPASQPHIKLVNGESRLCFKYPTKMCEEGRGDAGIEEVEFSIKYDIENVDTDKMTDKFKMDNSVYPRANVLPDRYLGNRWEYETEVNKLAWKLTALNPTLLYGKKGIVQRAVDSFRNLHRSTSSRRVVRMKKMNEGTLRKRQPENASVNSPSVVSVTWTQKGISKRCKVRIDIESIDYDKIDGEFKLKYSVFSGEFDDQSFGLGKWENMNEDNVLAVKLAFLNVDNTTFWNAVKATDKVTMLRKAVEAYKTKKNYEQTKEEPSSLTDMQQEDLYFIDPSEMNYREKSFYYYL